MGSRRRFRRALLIAAALLLVLAGGVAAAVLAGSDGGDDSVLLGGGADNTDEPAESDAPAESESAPDLPIPTDTEQQPEPQEQPPEAELGDSPSSGGGGAARKTNLPRERQQAQDDPKERVFAVPPARVFTGTGSAALGTVNVREAAIVKWTTTGRFELRFGREAFPIIAPSPSGQLVVPAFNFEQVRVIAKGRWKIRITPQG